MAKVLCCDQATKISGFSYFENGQYIESGVVDLSKSKLDTAERSFEMAKSIWKLIKNYKPDYIVLEDVQLQKNNAKTMIILARLCGEIIGYAYAHNVKVRIISPAAWRAKLEYRQGPKVKREELKQQSLDYVTEHLGVELPEDEAESCCLGIAAHEIYDFE